MEIISKIKNSEILDKPISAIRYVQHRRIMKKLNPYLKKSYDSLKNYKVTEQYDKNIIWIFWWQGENKLTTLSNYCVESIRRYSGERKVILITKNNIRKYIELPEYIYIKLRLGQITLTHLSDIVRANLLAKYGGLWLDATIYVTESLDNIPLNKIFTLSFSPNFDKRNKYISKCQWSAFCLGGPKNCKLFLFLKNFFDIYWKENNQLIDYFLIDYALRYAWDNNIGNFCTESKNNTNFAPNLYTLADIINDPYSITKWKEITKDTNIFKLSNKVKLNNNNNTFYSKICR